MRRLLRWCLGIITIILIITGIIAYSVYDQAMSTFDEIHTPVERNSSISRTEPVELEERQPFSILLLGVDERQRDSGRSDTMIVLSVNPQTNNTLMVSIPRDTYTQIVGKNIKDKINHAYAFGGIEMSMNSVEKLLNIPIDYVAKVNMEGFEQVINTVGGIQVENALAFQEGNYTFKKGDITLDGEAALAYVRMRKEDPQGDFGRQNRQKQVIQAVIEEGTSLKTLLKYQNIFDILGNNISTNLTFDQIKELQQSYRESLSNIQQIHFEKGKGKTIHGVWYYMMDSNELTEVSNTLKKHLQIDSKS
ncbi:LytR family transcriptional regulator [Rummeliibacillus sp. TYF005]|uniref:LCP family glycopolymer transferase n=1 Tax=unclassified Rummeliibacillus TaxID=2622809 RepID=UPI000E66BD87|nr:MULTISPECIES: LCP family protein [unclassified Rummeliibacillus]RIJ65065.1 LytR family transcriptional regulator [Rummeliibacillus sp. POC4]RPJ96841.1 LytR family transcriptional regulator [Rummeliibacillus sp. TYF005]